MRYQNSKTRFSRALTLVEMVIAMAIMAIVFAAILPQFRAIQNSWDSKASAAETLQNSRVLIDHLNRNLSKAVQITAVSDSAQTNGYIEFEDNDANSVRYDINGATSYVEFGPVGNLADLAGPASQLQFTCYDACDLDTPITNVADIRSVKVQATLTNPGPGQDLTLTTQTYLRTNLDDGGYYTISTAPGSPLEFDDKLGRRPTLCQIDSTHYLCAYSGFGNDGWAIVLTVSTGNWTITAQTPLEFDTQYGGAPALYQIDGTHYLCVYTGFSQDGWAVILTVDTGNWTITKETPFEFDNQEATTPALAKVDDTHYLCAYTDKFQDGKAVALAVNTGNWTISKGTAYEFDTANGQEPALAKIDDEHYLCAYEGDGDDGWAVVLTVNTGNWSITKETPREFDTKKKGREPALFQIDSDHYLCAYRGDGDDGWAVVLSVNPSNQLITEKTPFEFDIKKGEVPSLCQIDGTHYLCAYEGDHDDGWAVVLTVNTDAWSITKETPFEFDSDKGKQPSLWKIDGSHYLCVYRGPGDDGYAVILGLSALVLP